MTPTRRRSPLPARAPQPAPDHRIAPFTAADHRADSRDGLNWPQHDSLNRSHAATSERSVDRGLAVLVAAASIAAAAPAVAPVSDSSPITPAVAVAKSCSGSYTHAVIRGAHKCLRRGQFCARAADRQYHRYGFHCHKRDARGNYHLT
jgi:hypothetical protein